MSAPMKKVIFHLLRNRIQNRHSYLQACSPFYAVVPGNVIRYSTQQLTQLDDEDEVEYPPIKPRYPPGGWGSMEPFIAWRWHESEKKYLALPLRDERIRALAAGQHPMWLYPMTHNVPGILPYQQYILKTHLAKGLPSYYDDVNVDSELDAVRHLLEDIVLIESEIVKRDHLSRNYAVPYNVRSPTDRKKAHLFLGNIIRTLVPFLCSRYPYLKTCHIGENAPIEGIWNRFGVQRRKPYLDPIKYIPPINKKKNFQLVTHADSTYRVEDWTADFQLRTEESLPEILPLDHDLCLTAEYPELKYYPTVLGQSYDHRKATITPGFKLGDPNEFGTLTLLATNYVGLFAQMYTQEYADESEIGLGMSSSFISLLTQAHYQGFSMYSELTYPLCTQTVISNGQDFQFFVYQLNTTQLFKDDDGNPRRNLCWHTDKMRLYEKVENGQVIGLNDDVLKNLLKFFLNVPCDRGIDLQPNFPRADCPRSQMTYIEEPPVIEPEPEETIL